MGAVLFAMFAPTLVFGLFALICMRFGAESRPYFDERPVVDDRPNWFPIAGAGSGRRRRGRRGTARRRRAGRGRAGADRRAWSERRPPSAGRRAARVREQRGHQPVGRVIGRLDVGREAELAIAALVAGPIETSRGPDSVPAAAWRKRADEAEVNVA